jgi:peptidoglycan/LPS O-acetylase OafA/YrhL
MEPSDDQKWKLSPFFRILALLLTAVCIFILVDAAAKPEELDSNKVLTGLGGISDGYYSIA